VAALLSAIICSLGNTATDTKAEGIERQIVMKYLYLFLFSFLYFSLDSKAQLPEFDIATTKNDTSNYIIYLTALWCKPCMDKLPTIIDSFSKIPNYKFVVWFERKYLDTENDIIKKVREKYSSTLYYYIFPIKHYPKKYKLIEINPQNKVLKNIMAELNTLGGLQLTLNDISWGHLILIKKSKYYVAKNKSTDAQIAEIKALL